MRATAELVVVVGWGIVPILIFRLWRLRRAVRRASHEIRGPLSAVQIGLYSVSRDRGDHVGSEGVAVLTPHLRRVELALEDLERTALCKRDRGLGNAKSIDLWELVSRVVDAWRPVIEESGRFLEVDWRAGKIAVQGDGARLEQALANLLANALEHGSGPVMVRSRQVDGRILVEVNDQGQVQLPRKAPSTEKGRRGHGLKIVSETATRHGGTVEAQVSPEGTTIWMDLPAAELERCAPA